MLWTQLEPQSGLCTAQATGVLISMASPLAGSVSFYRTVEQPRAHAMVETFAALEQVPSHAGIVRACQGSGCVRHLCIEVADDIKELEPAPVLMVVAFRVPQAHCTQVDEWYECEHAPLLLKADGWLRARRYHGFISHGDEPWTHVALHDLRELAVLDSKERAVARSTAWRARLCAESWFQQAGRWIYERLA